MSTDRKTFSEWFFGLTLQQNSRRKLSNRNLSPAGLESLEDRVLLSAINGKRARNDITNIEADATPNRVRGNVLTNDTVAEGSGSRLKVSAIFNASGTKRSVPAGAAGKAIAGDFGTLKIYSNGRFVYKVNKNDPAVRALKDGEKLLETFTYIARNNKPGVVNAKLRIRVLGVNDAPKITSSATASLAENSTSVIDVNSTDVEGDTEGAGLTYSISGGLDSALFDIDATTGELEFKSAPDFENPEDDGGNNVYDVQVTVTDSGSATDVQDIAVTVTDVVENTAPKITSDNGGATATVSVGEEQTAVTNVQSSDDNDSEGSGLAYSISGGADSALFEIDSSTGELTFKTAPDFENPTDAGTNNVYDVQVTVKDSGGLSDVQDIAVTVTDVGETDPFITTIGFFGFLNIDENLTSVVDIDATDADGDTEGAGLTYSISGGVDGAHFTIDENTGELSFISAPDYENPTDSNTNNYYQVEVTVTDSIGLTHSRSYIVEVNNV